LYGKYAQSDLVKMVFELPYMPEEMRDRFRFSTDFLKQELEAVKNDNLTGERNLF